MGVAGSLLNASIISYRDGGGFVWPAPINDAYRTRHTSCCIGVDIVVLPNDDQHDLYQSSLTLERLATNAVFRDEK